ncbi:hypothetical protein [Williamsoniiplasma lucivorax]|uniref:Uncharacterized protein n=1 Tax=Williamsoniiplasma lucivorax TaxID=209274 RepID=A0A2S5RF58_9MOLU|nr:hypothetical protein [Williamsoniiplasma lucivorax]PPE05927.1 hypothetical protein ELUCI_v1c02180 [Williamsoniiplasma lucivorax]
MKFKYNDLLNSLIEEEILLVKYRYSKNEDTRIIELIKVWDSTHNVRTLHDWVWKAIQEYNKNMKKVRVGKQESNWTEEENSTWVSIMRDILPFTSAISIFAKEYNNVLKEQSNFISWYRNSESDLIKQTIYNLWNWVFDDQYDNIREKRVPPYMYVGLKELWKHFIRAKFKSDDSDMFFDLMKETYKFMIVLFSDLRFSEFPLTLRQEEQANDFLNWLAHFSKLIATLLLISEKILIIEDEKMNIKNKTYDFLEDRERKLEVFRKLSQKTYN